MVNETWTTVVGNVASDVSWRRTPNGGEVANFRVMSTERRFEAESGSWQDGARLAVRVNCWRRLGENVRTCVTKGDPVIVHGKLSVREFEVDGIRRSSTEIEARSVGLDLSRVPAKVVPAEPAAGGRPVLDVTALAVVEDGRPGVERDEGAVPTAAASPFDGDVAGEAGVDGADGGEELDRSVRAS